MLRRFLDESAASGFADPRFERQKAAHFFDLYRLFTAVYGRRTDWQAQFESLLTTLRGAWFARSDELKALDAQRVERGAWYADGSWVAMMLYVRRFAGTLTGLKQQLDYFQDLGVNVLHLMPLLSAPADHNDGGYAVSDYRTVDPQVGSNADLQELTAEMHRRGMAVVLDYVLNHTSDQHEWAQRALAGDTEYQGYYYTFQDRTIPDVFEGTLPEVFPETAPGNFTYRPEMQRWVMTVFHSYQWDLNYTNPRVFVEMTANMLHLANLGVDIFRLDAVPYLWKRIGTASQNLDEAHILLRLLNACLRIASPGTACIAEAIVQPREIARYFGEDGWEGRECELAYNASLMVLLWDALATGRARLLQYALSELPHPPAETTWLNYVRCHDDIGLGYDESHIRREGWDPAAHKHFILQYYTGEFPGSRARGERFMFNPKNGDARISGTAAALAGIEQAILDDDQPALEVAIRRLIALHAVVFSFGGVPVIYAGDEIAVGNDYSYRDEAATAADNRWMHRPHLPQKLRDRRRRAGTVEARVFTKLRSLLGTRQRLAPLRSVLPPEVVPLENPHVFGYLKRSAEGARVLVLTNFSALDQAVERGALATCGFTHRALDVAHGVARTIDADGIVLRPYEFVWLTDDF